MAKKKKMENTEGKPQLVPIKWHTSDNITSRYATHVLVHIMEEEFKISFYEMQPEIRLDTNDPLPKEVQANCVTNIILSPNKVLRLINALQTQHDKYTQIRAKK